MRGAKLGVVILGAGRSRRMGKPKLLLPWGDTSILGHQINIWPKLGAAQVGIVCAADDNTIQIELDRLSFTAADRIQNPRPEEGMFSSIRCAAQWDRWRPELTHWALTLGDQPHLRLETLKAIIEFSRLHPTEICQPRRLGHHRHPVILPKPIFRELVETTHSTLEEFLNTKAIAGCDLDDPGLDLDIDIAEDYEKALRLRF